MSEVLPRLWVNQTPNFVIGYHHYGTFDDIRVQDARDEIEDWEEQNEERLGHL